MRELPRGLWTFLGAVGCVGGLALLVPGAANLTAIAAGVVAVQSLLISAFYVRYRDTSPLPYSAVMVLFAVVICYGRLELQPL
jgi:4-hydroxybenzoate polyprenyltransferase